MKLSQHIAMMQAILEEKGDLDVACTTGGPTTDPENEILAAHHIQVVEENDNAKTLIHPRGTTFPYVLIGGEEE